jgi:beta-glucanase (GH16 family)
MIQLKNLWKDALASLIIASFLICLMSGCKKDDKTTTVNNTEDPAASDPTLKLVFSDEFNGSAIDTTKWNFEINGNGEGNGELEYYTNRSQNAAIKDGKLVITALKESYNGANYTSARMTTAGKGEFTYGRFEAKMKLPYGRGIWPAFWLLSNTQPLDWPNTGEIDIMEAVGYRPDTVFSNIHSTDYYGGKGDLLAVPNYSTGYHVYAADWTPDSIKFFVDTKQLFAFANPHLADATANHAEWPFDHPFFMLLNVAVGGAWGGIQGVDDSIFPQTMSVDWVRVYQKK